MSTKWACGECGCRWDSDFEAKRCAEKDLRRAKARVEGSVKTTLNESDTARAIKIAQKVVKLKRQIDPIGGYVEGDEFRHGLDSRLTELHRYISSRLTKEERELIKST